MNFLCNREHKPSFKIEGITVRNLQKPHNHKVLEVMALTCLKRTPNATHKLKENIGIKFHLQRTNYLQKRMYIKNIYKSNIFKNINDVNIRYSLMTHI